MHWHCPIHIKFLLALICGVAGFAACAQNGVGQGAVAANLLQQALAYENGEGVARDQILAASLYCQVARRMLKVVGSPAAEVPECMREPTSPAAEPALPAVPLPRVDYRAIAPRKIFDLVMKLAPPVKVEPQLALAIIAAESNFNSLAVSVKSAQGLMQLIPPTGQRFNVLLTFFLAPPQGSL